MNLIDAEVKEILGERLYKNKDTGKVYKLVKVRYVDMGDEGIDEIMIDEDTKTPRIYAGYKYQH